MIKYKIDFKVTETVEKWASVECENSDLNLAKIEAESLIQDDLLEYEEASEIVMEILDINQLPKDHIITNSYALEELEDDTQVEEALQSLITDVQSQIDGLTNRNDLVFNVYDVNTWQIMLNNLLIIKAAIIPEEEL